jgi:hypothetical protein
MTAGSGFPHHLRLETLAVSIARVLHRRPAKATYSGGQRGWRILGRIPQLAGQLR